MNRIVAAVLATAVVMGAAAAVRVHSQATAPGTVRGTVSVDGKPVPAGSLLLVSDSPQWATVGVIGADGRYRIEGVPPGPVRVGVRTRRVGREELAAAGREPVATPRRFEDPGGSGIVMRVEPGDQTVNIDLPGE